MGQENNARENNFNMIRITASILVFAGHMGMILGIGAPAFGYFPLHEVGVAILFIIAGYLITQSWMKDPDPLRYGIRRFFRLWPPFAVMVLIMTFVTGPFISKLGPAGYFADKFAIYLWNLRFYIVYTQPGVFTELPVANATNGSLWTMPVEAAMYLITPLIATALRIRNKDDSSFRTMAVFYGFVLLVEQNLHLFFADTMVIFYGVNLISAFHLTVMYVAGIFYTFPQSRKLLNLQRACAGMALLLILGKVPGPLQYLSFDLILPYFIFSLALAEEPVFHRVGRKLDPSYGIYLYGFFFQQLIMQLQVDRGERWEYVPTFLIAGGVTLAAAVLSFYLTEKPSQRLAHFLLGKTEGKS